MIIDELFSTVLQIIVFSLIPFLVYVIQRRTARDFFDYIGLKRATRAANGWAVFTSLLFVGPALVLTLIDAEFREIMLDPNTVTGRIRLLGFGWEAIFVIVIVAVFRTALSEEIFFRGFLAKRLITFLGYRWGNIIQAALFGLLHSAIVLVITANPVYLAVIFLFPALGSYLSVYLNEKLGKGSIVPGWISHGLANLISYTVVGFLI